MKIITRQGLADAAKERWYRQYRSEVDGIKPSYLSDKRDIYDKLCAIDVVTPESVNDAIGNASWTMISCDECNREVDAVIEMGEEQYYESATAHVCVECIRTALAKMEANNEET